MKCDGKINFNLLEGKLKPCGTVGWKDCTKELQGRGISYFLGILCYFTFRYIYIYIYIVDFENLMVEFHVFNMYIKFYLNKILFIIRLIKLFFYTQF